MKALLIKDFKLMKGQKSFFLILLVMVFAMAIFSQDVSFSLSFPTFILAIFAISSISYDELDNGFSFLFTLPITRKEYVREKYLLGLLLGGGSLLGSGLLNGFILLIKGTGGIQEIILLSCFLMPVILLVLSVVIPIQLKFGAEKGRLALFLIFGAITLSTIALIQILSLFDINIENTLSSLSQLHLASMISIVIIIAIAISLISVAISQSIMTNKEF